MSAVGTTYSFRDLTGAITNPLIDTIQLTGGNVGVGSITINMATQRTEQDVAADGAVMPTYIAGDNGDVSIEVQQTSGLHHTLLSLYNQLKTAADGGDVSNWAATAITFRTLLDGSHHVITGVSFQKIPPKPYAAHGAKVTWTLMACNISNT
jgi:hypothetical protein